jgi:nucleoside-diphosphate-sugar epimerase
MKILLLGGSGFLSGTMARCALRDGHEVWAVTRGQKQLLPSLHSIVADRKNASEFACAIATANQHWDLVIDCIGYSADDAKQDLECFATRAEHLVFISTDFVLGPIDRPWKVDETYDRFNDTPYGIGKRAAEEVLLIHAQQSRASKMRVTVLRPCHIYVPGSLLGCLPKHGRDPQLIDRIKRGESLTLVGGGFFLQQPVFAEDLWTMAVSCFNNEHTNGQIYFAPGPDIVESREFYRIIANILGVDLTIDEVSITDYLREHPEHASFCAHRVYDTGKAKRHALKLPGTPPRLGLSRHVEDALRARV